MKHVLFLVCFFPILASGQTSYNMSLLSNWDLPDLPTRFGSEYSDCWGYKHPNGTEVAIIGGIEDIFFVNVTSPGNPVLIHTHHVTNIPTGGDNQSLWRDFKVYGNYAYASADEGTSGLLIFDLSQVPATVTMVHQTINFWTRTHNIYIDEANARLYAAGSNTVSNGLVILDLSENPDEPTLLGNVALNGFGGGYVHDVHVRDNIAYCSHGSLSKLQIYDMNNLANISVIGTIENYPEDGYNHSSWLNADESLLVMCDETHGSDIKVVDVTNPADISNDDIHTFYSELEGPAAPGASVAHNPFILGDYVYIAYYHDGVQVFDISDPANVDLLAYYDTYPDNDNYNGYEGCWGVYPYLPSGIVLGSDQTYGLYVLQVASFPLDIEFVEFDARRMQRGVQLTWSIVDPSEGNRFEVKRSTDGGITFITIGEAFLVEGQSQYTFQDYSAFDNAGYSYRIDFMQDDGLSIPSPMKHVRGLSKPNPIHIANPVQQHLTINSRDVLQSVNMEIYDANGILVWHRTLEQSSPRMEFPLNDLPPAAYMISVEWDGGSMRTLINKIE